MWYAYFIISLYKDTFVNSLRPCSAPSYYLNQCWLIVNWNLSNNIQWNFNQNTKIFIQENAFKNVACETTCLETCRWSDALSMRRPVNSPHKCQWHRALIFSVICVWINGWVNYRETGELRRYRAHYDVIAMSIQPIAILPFQIIDQFSINLDQFSINLESNKIELENRANTLVHWWKMISVGVSIFHNYVRIWTIAFMSFAG